MIERLLPAQRRFTVERAGMAVLTLLWLVCLVLGLGPAGHPSHFGKPMEAGDMDPVVGDELTVARTASGS